MEKKLLSFLETVDCDFSPRLSEKVSLREFAKKIVSISHYEYEEDDEKNLKGLLVGYANDREKHYSYISLLAIKPEYRNQGIAKQLVSQFIKYAYNQDFIYTVGVHSNNPVAIKVYQNFGFEVIYCNDNRYYLEMKVR